MRTSSRTWISARLGPTLLTANALARLHPADVVAGLQRHAQRELNRHAADPDQVQPPCCRRLSAHHDRHGSAFWIITEACGRRTTVMLPEDF